jgi:hypothetical protein
VAVISEDFADLLPIGLKPREVVFCAVAADFEEGDPLYPNVPFRTD